MPLLRATREGADGVLDMACFPLVPYVNRIRGGRFSFRGREVVLKPNMAGDISPLHGQGWLAAWSVESSSERARRTALRAWGGRMAVALRGAAGVRAGRERPVAAARMPQSRRQRRCRAGLASILISRAAPRPASRPRSATAFEIDEHVLPIGEVPATGRYDLADRAVCGQGLDHGFGGLGRNGAAERSQPGRRRYGFRARPRASSSFIRRPRAGSSSPSR